MGPRLKRNVKSSAAWFVAENIVNVAVAMCTTLVVGRIIGPTEFGLAALAYLFGSLGEVVVTTSMVDPLIQRRRFDASLVNAGFTAMVTMGVGTYLVILIAAPLLAYLYEKPALLGLLAAQGTTCVLMGLRGVPEAMLARKLRFNLISMRSIVAKVASAVVSVLAAWLGMGAWSIVLGNIAFSAGSTIMVLMVVTRMPRFAYLPKHMASLFSFGLFSMTEALLWTATPRLFSFCVGYFHGVRVLGELNIAFRINDTAFALIGGAASRFALPVLSRNAENRHRLQQDFLHGTRLVCLIVAPAFLGLAFTSKEVIDISLGREWPLAASSLTAVCLFSLLCLSRLLALPTVKAVAKPRLLIGPNVVGLVYIVASSWLLRHAEFEVALGIWVSFGIVFLLCSLRMVQKAIGIDWWTQLKPLGSVVLPTIAMSLVLYGLGVLHPVDSVLVMLLLKVIGGGMTYLLLLFALERPLLIQIVGRSAPQVNG